LVVVGLAAAGAAQLLNGSAPLPLYDGVSVSEPYRFLSPGPDQPGDPFSAKATLAIDSTQSPRLLVATEEVPPQAQLIASDGALALPSGATQLTVTITPVAPSAEQASAAISGNVYRIVIVDQAGNPVAVDPSKNVTVALRKPVAGVSMALQRWDGESWTHVPGNESPSSEIVGAPTRELGDFVLEPVAGGLPLWLLVAGAVLVAGIGAALILTIRRSRRRIEAVAATEPVEPIVHRPLTRKRRRPR
jgi:hypothetical protein